MINPNYLRNLLLQNQEASNLNGANTSNLQKMLPQRFPNIANVNAEPVQNTHLPPMNPNFARFPLESENDNLEERMQGEEEAGALNPNEYQLDDAKQQALSKLDTTRPNEAYFKPKWYNKLTAASAGLSAGIQQGGDAGVRAAQNVLNTPYQTAVARWASAREPIAEEAKNEMAANQQKLLMRHYDQTNEINTLKVQNQQNQFEEKQRVEKEKQKALAEKPVKVDMKSGDSQTIKGKQTWYSIITKADGTQTVEEVKDENGNPIAFDPSTKSAASLYAKSRVLSALTSHARFMYDKFGIVADDYKSGDLGTMADRLIAGGNIGTMSPVPGVPTNTEGEPIGPGTLEGQAYNPTAATRKSISAAPVVLDTGKEILAWIDKHEKMFGAGAGLKNWLTSKVARQSEDYAHYQRLMVGLTGQVPSIHYATTDKALAILKVVLPETSFNDPDVVKDWVKGQMEMANRIKTQQKGMFYQAKPGSVGKPGEVNPNKVLTEKDFEDFFKGGK
jgi:hypothetical protein